MNILCLELEKLRPQLVRNDYEAGYDQAITQAQIVIEECAAKADRSAKRQDPQGLGLKGESGGARKGICTTTVGTTPVEGRVGT